MQVKESDTPEVREVPPLRVTSPSEAASLYDEEYYRTACGPLPYERSDHWINFFGGIAEHLIRSLKPARVLDAGCAMGFLVEAFWDRGVEAWGIDISPYAIANVRRDMQPFCRTGSLTEPIEQAFDLITCIEVIEHMAEDDARTAIANMCAAAEKILFSSSSSDFTEPTHICVRPPLFWLKVFAEFGFYPDPGYDAGFVTPHAMLMRRNPAGMSDDLLALYAEHIRNRCLLQERQRSLSDLASQNSALVQQKGAMADSIAQLESRVASLQGDERALRTQIETLNEQLENAVWRTEEHAESRAALELANTQLRSETAALADKFDRTQRELKATVAAHDRFHAHVSELLSAAQADAERTHAAAEQLVSQTNGLRAGVDEVAAQVRDLVESRIWRTLCWVGGIVLAAGSLGRRSHGSSLASPTVEQAVPPVRPKTEYETWIEDFEDLAPELPYSELRGNVILSAADATPYQVQASVASLHAQSYPNWELVITSQDPPETAAIRAASASAADGFTLLMSAGDTLSPHAMLYFAEAFERNPETDLVYSDEDRLSSEGKREQPFFKPDFSPDLLLSQNYIGRPVAARNTLLQAAGESQAFDHGDDREYDLVLRLVEKANRVEHIPRILYHRADGSIQPCFAAGGEAIQRYLARRGISAKVKPAAVSGSWRVWYDVPKNLRVSIIIGSGGKLDVLRTNLDTLFSKTTWPHYEVVVIDNSDGNAIEGYVNGLCSHRDNLRYMDWRNRRFNYSAINNRAAATCKNPILLFLNDDTSVIEPDWLTTMVQLIARPEVGAVGAKLLYPDGRIQHGGVFMGVWENCGHAFKGLPGDRPHYFGLSDVTRNVSAVTGACLMTRADIFREIGGFDEHNLPVAFNDIDLCLRISAKGYRVLYTPEALLYHYEAFSKTPEDLTPNPSEVRYMQTCWRKVIAADPYYSPNLTRTAEDYSLRKKTS